MALRVIGLGSAGLALLISRCLVIYGACYIEVALSRVRLLVLAFCWASSFGSQTQGIAEVSSYCVALFQDHKNVVYNLFLFHLRSSFSGFRHFISHVDELIAEYLSVSLCAVNCSRLSFCRFPALPPQIREVSFLPGFPLFGCFFFFF